MLTAPVPRAGTDRPAAAWSMLHPVAEAWSWPTWAPDGRALAAFSVEPSDESAGPARVMVLSLDGVQQTEVAQLDESAPVYLQWEPRGRGFAVLAQQAGELALLFLRLDRLGVVRPIETGAPLFLNWTDGGERVLLHVGARGGPGRLMVRDPFGGAEDVLLDGEPGTFCAPVWVAGRMVVAFEVPDDEGLSLVVACNIDGSERLPLVRRRGLVAIVPGPPASPFVAISAAPGGEGTPYVGIDVVNVLTGGIRRISERECLAFFWAPTGDWVLQAVVESAENCLSWYRVPLDGGPADPLGSFWPTRDVLFYLHFFDQYASSHPFVSADGRHIAFAGYPAGGGQADLSDGPRIWVRELGGGLAEPVAHGSFAVWSPR